MRGDLMGRKKEGSRYIRRCLSYVESMMLSHGVRVPPPFLSFFSPLIFSPHFFSHFFSIPPSSSLPSLDPLINAGVKLLFISDRDLGNGGEPPIDQGEKIVTRSGIDRNEPRRE